MEKIPNDESGYGLIIKGSGQILEDKKLLNKKILKVCEDNTQEDYDSINISTFGLKYLKNLGYSENNPNNTKPFEPQVRVKGVGLGVDSDLALIDKESGNDEKDLKINRNLYGELFDIIDGKYKGLKCYLKDKCKTIEELYKKDLVHAELTENHKEVKVSTRNLKLSVINININDNIDINGKNNQNNNFKIESSSRKNENISESCIKNNFKIESENNSNLKNEKCEKKKIEWIRENILVRIVNKNLNSYFMKKAVVIQILDPYTFQLRILDTGENLTTLKEDDLQTVIPKKTYTQMIGVKGKYNGQILEYIGKVKGGNILVRVDNYKEVPISPDTLSELYIINNN